MKKYYRYNNCYYLFIVMGIFIYAFLLFGLIVGLIEENKDTIFTVVVSMILVFPMILFSILFIKRDYLIIEENIIKKYRNKELKEEFKISDIKEIYINIIQGYRGSFFNMSFVFETTNKLELQGKEYFNYLKSNNIKYFTYIFNKKILSEIKPRKYNIKLNKPYQEV